MDDRLESGFGGRADEKIQTAREAPPLLGRKKSYPQHLTIARSVFSIVKKRLLRIPFIKNTNDNIKLLHFQVYNLIMYHKREVFSSICIETQSACNRRCWHCPVAYYPRKKVIMSEAVFHRIIDQLAERNYKGEIGLFWYNEPLLDKRLPQFIQYAHKKCPESYIYIASNGDLLDMDLFRTLIEAGLSYIHILYYDGDLKRHLRELLNSVDDSEKKHLHIAKSSYICNRAGALKERQIQKSLKQKCSRSEYQITVNAEGKVLLCCMDYFEKETIGDITKENIFDIWIKDRFQKIRKELRKGNRQNIDICSKCDFVFEGYRMLPKKRAVIMVSYE
jgi:radical SAM protein with 4Fe4S-binding SPASM domain